MPSAAAVHTPASAPFQKTSIRFPARSFLAFALAPEAPLAQWFESLDRWTENSPAFFIGRPVVLDLNLLKPAAHAVRGLVAQLAERGIRIYAIEANGLDGIDADLPPLLKGARPTLIDGTIQPKAPEPGPATAEDSNTLTIASPVRSGQSIFHPAGDVVIVGSVASGSEVVAGGSVHVYGTLRGRAIAGATGKADARIFCLRNEAELLAVDGWYRTAEEMEPSLRGRPVQAFLKNNALQVADLN